MNYSNKFYMWEVSFAVKGEVYPNQQYVMTRDPDGTDVVSQFYRVFGNVYKIEQVLKIAFKHTCRTDPEVFLEYERHAKELKDRIKGLHQRVKDLEDELASYEHRVPGLIGEVLKVKPPDEFPTYTPPDL